MIQWAIGAAALVLALNVPSMFDAQIGTISDATVHALATLTPAQPKRGLAVAGNWHAVGDLYLADMSE